MEELFEFEGQEYTLAEVQKAAEAKSLNIDDYIKEYNISRKPGKELPPKEDSQGAPAEETAAPAIQPTVTEFKLENGFLGSLKNQVLNTRTGTVADTLIEDYQPSLIQIGAEKTLISFKQAFKGIEVKNAAANLNKFQEKVKGLNLDDEIEYAGYTDVPVAEGTLEGAIRKATSPSKKGTVAEANKYYAEKLLTPLIQTQEYQETLKRFKSPEVLDGLTLDEYKQMMGEQGFQMFGAVATFGLSTYYQETSNILLEAAREKVIQKNNITEQDFESYAPNIKASLMLEAFEDGDINIKKAVEGGVANAGLDLVSNYFVLGKGLKFMPKDFFRALVNGRVKKILKYTATGVPPVLGEVATEVGQERIAEIKTAEAIDEETPEINAKKYGEVAAQTLLTTGGIQTGLKTGATAFKEIKAITDINKIEARAITNEIKLKVNDNFKNGNITKQKRDELYNNIEAAEEIINDSKYENFDSESKKITFDNILNKSAVQKQIENINKNISQQKKNNIPTSSEEFILNKKKEELNRYQNNIDKEFIFQNYKNNGKSLAQFVNNSTEGIFKNRNVEIFKNKNSLFKYLKENNIELKDEYVNDINNGVVNGFERAGVAYILEDNIKNNLLKGTLNASNTVHHEVLHFVLNSMDQETVTDIKNSVENELNNSSDPTIKKIAKLVNEQLKIYNEKDKPQEFFTAISDAFRTLEIFDNINNSKKAETFYNISESIKSIFNKKLPQLNISQLDGNNTLEWIKKYNSFNGTKPKFKINAKVGKVDIDENEIKEDIQASLTESSNKVQKIFDEKGKDGAFDIIEAYKPLTTKLTNKYRDVPGFDFELLQSEIEIGKRGLLDLINAYDPSKGAALNTYIQGQLANRSIEAANRILDTEFKLDVTEAKSVTDTVTAEETIEAAEKAEFADEIKSLRKEIGLPEELVSTVKDAVVKTFGTKLPNPQDPKFRLELQKRFRTELKKPLAKFVGKQADYESFLRDNFQSIYNKLPQSLINKRFKDFQEPVLDNNGKHVREKTAEGNKVYTKKKISKAEFIKYFLGSDVGRSTQGTRKTAIVEAVAEEIAFDATMEVLNDPDVIQKYQDIAEITGDILPDNYLAQIAKQIDRNEDFKFSKSISNDSGLSNQELSSILFKGFISAAGKVDPKIIEILLDDAWAKNFPSVLEDFIFPGYKEALKNKTIEEQADVTKYLINIISRPLRTASYQSKKLEYNTNTRLFRRLEKIAGKELFGNLGSGALIQLEQIQNQDKNGNWTTRSYIRDKNGIALGSSTYNTSTQTFHKDLINNKLSREEVDGVFSENRKRLKEIIFKLGAKNKGLAISLIKLTQKDQRGLLRSSGQIGGIVQNYDGETVFEHRPPVQYLFEKIVDYIENPTKAKKQKLNTLLNTAQINVVPKDFADIVDQDYKITIPSDGKISYENALNKTNYEFDGNFKFSKTLNREFNEKILEATTNVDWFKKYSPVEARIVSRGKGNKKFFIPYSADDFVGLLYATLGKGKVGNEQLEWYQENLIKPFSRGIQQYESAKQNALREWNIIKKEAKKDVPGGLQKRNETGLTNQDSVRLYIWKMQQMEIPGIDSKLVNKNLKIVLKDEKLKEFAERLMALNPEGYPKPSDNWDSGDITTDIVNYINSVKRTEFLQSWNDNVEVIFSEQNKNKLKALYGDAYVDALNDILYRMKTGRNRKMGISKIEQRFMDWTNNSVGAIMFFNARSAVLQTLSAVNFINFTDNNPINAGIAFANQPQYWKDFSTLFNSDFLKQRRTGLQTDISSDEIARAAKGAKNTARAALSAILKFGFTPTQIADSFAIASGGATFYRNRINKYKKEGLEQSEAEEKAFTDFQEIAEETQQSARPDRISMQQAGSLGRIILAFGNTPMQYARLTKKAALDLVNGRGDWKTNISKIMYYSVIQNIIFSTLQQGLFALLFSDEEDDKEKERIYKLGNGILDSFLRGTGVYGAAASTVKNMVLKTIDESQKNRPDYTKAAIESTSLSPPINSKIRKLMAAGRTFTYKQSKEKVFTEGFSLENPALLAAGQIISAGTNLPADRVILKADHIKTAMEPETELWQAIALSLGWSEWDLGMIEKQTKKSSIKKPIKIQTGLKKNKIKVGIK